MGLYQRAFAHIRKSAGSEAADFELDPETESGITAKEREQFIAQINDITSKNRSAARQVVPRLVAKKRGVLLPILINGFSILIVAAAVVLLTRFFNVRESTIVTQSSAVVTTETTLFEALRQESQEQLSQKESEITRIQGEMAAIGQQRDELKATSAAQVQQKERELRDAFNRELEAERVRLQSQGLSTTNITQRMESFEAQKSAQLDAALSSYKATADAELAKKQREMDALNSTYQASLRQAQQDRVAFQQQLASRETQLQQQLSEKDRALAAEKSRAAQELGAMTDLQQKENLATDQVGALFQSAFDQVRTADYQKALATLKTAEDLLNAQWILSLPGMKRRRASDLMTIQTMRTMIDNEIAQGATRSVDARARSTLNAIAAGFSEAEGLYKKGDTLGAQKSYLEVLATIPEVRQSAEKLDQIEQLSYEVAREQAARSIKEGDALSSAGSSSKAVAQYLAGLKLLKSEDRTFDQTVGKILSALDDSVRAAEKSRQAATLSAQAAEQKALETSEKVRALQESLAKSKDTTALVGRIDTLRNGYEQYMTTHQSGADISQKALRDLLEAKLIVKQIILSEPVLSKYPELDTTMNEYYEVLSENSKAEARASTLQDLIGLVEVLESSEASGDGLTGIWQRYQEEHEQDLFLALFDRMRELLK